MTRLLKRAAAGLALLFASLLVFGAAYHPRAEIPAGFKGRLVRLPDGVIRVEQKGSGPDLLLIHGCPGSIEDWTPVFDKLARHYRVTAYDRPDYGFSVVRGNDYTLAYNARVARELIDKLGLKDPLIVGHSYGGATALWMLVHHEPGVRGYVLLGAPAYGPVDLDPIVHLTAIPVLGRGLAMALSPVLGPAVVKSGLAKGFGPDASLLNDGFVSLRTRLWTRREAPYTRARELVRLEAGLREMMPHYREVRRKVYIVQGRNDTVAQSAWKLHWEMPQSELVVLENTGHYAQFGEPDQVVAVIDRAMKETQGRKGS